MMPTAVEMVYDNYNALVFGFAPVNARQRQSCRWLSFPSDQSLLFQGAGLKDPNGILRGSGNVVRSIALERAATS